MRGKRPVPTEVKALRGTERSHHKKIPNTVEAVGSLGDPPSWMSDAEAALYLEMAESLPDGVLRSCDTALYARYVAAYVQYQALREQIADLDRIDASTPELLIAALKAKPGLMRMMVKVSEVMLRMEAEMGLTPSARSRVSSVAPPGESEFEAFMNRGKKPASA
jgi:P27 family predicted phage terminase small subunit